jgi:methylglutaconyl-CoA hydratase
MTQGYQTLEIDHRKGVAVVRMARERVRNAFNESMIEELDACVSELGADESVRAVVLAGRGPVFCAGADLDWMSRMADFSEEENRRDALQLARMLRTLFECPKPTIARVHGDAYGGGLGLICVCDVALASKTASFCLSEARLGLIPATIAPYVVRAMGQRHALRYFQTAERFDSAEAVRIGLVHAVTRGANGLVHAGALQPIDDRLLADTAQRIAAARGSDDGREGVRAFLQKRKPHWQMPAPGATAGGSDGDDEEM